MTIIERAEPHTERDEIAVAIVDTDVHPMPVSTDVLKSYAPPEWVDRIWPTGNAVTPLPHFYDTPDSYKTMSMRVDAAPPGGGFAGTDPDYAAKQLLVDAGVGIATLEPMCDAQLPQAEHVLKSTYNDWLADVWLERNNSHGRWRGSISVSAQVPDQAAREVERWAGHPYMAQVLNPLRQPAFRSALRRRIGQRTAGGHPFDGTDAVRADSALPGGQSGALA
jgi:predicted TIM-barrel fold metal-dependent hydrolase